MKKILMTIAALVLLVACVNKNGQSTGDQQSAAQTAEDEIKADVTEYYLTLNNMAQGEDGLNIDRLDRMFCSDNLLALIDKAAEKSKEATSPEQAFNDEGEHWLKGLKTPISVQIDKMIVEGDAAAAMLTLWDDSLTASVVLAMSKIGDKWKIDDFVDGEIHQISLRQSINAFLEE